MGCNNRNDSKTRSYTTRIEQEAFDRRSEHVRVNVRDGAGSNNGPRSRSYTIRPGLRPPGIGITEHAKVIRCNRAAKVEDCLGAAHNNDPRNSSIVKCAFVEDQSNKDAKEQKAFGRRSEYSRVNVRDDAGSNKDSDPRSRSYIKRSGQRPPGVSVSEHPNVIRCDRAAKVEDCLGAAHNNESQNSSIEECAFIEDQVEVNGSNCFVHNKSSGPRTWGYTNRSEQHLSGVCATSIDQVKTKANQTVDGDRSPEDAKSKDYLGVKTVDGDRSPEDAKLKDYLGVERSNFTHNKVTQCPGIAHNKDPHNIETNDWTLAARRSPKGAKLNDYLDVGRNNRNGSKTRSYTTRIEQEAFDRRSEHVMMALVPIKIMVLDQGVTP